MATAEQHRAMLAFSHVNAIKQLDEKRRKKYASMVHTMPALLRSAGLCQAMHFVASRNNGDQRVLLNHFAEQLRRVVNQISNPDALLDKVRGANLSAYFRLTHEALAVADWYRRMVQSILKIEAGGDNDTD